MVSAGLAVGGLEAWIRHRGNIPIVHRNAVSRSEGLVAALTLNSGSAFRKGHNFHTIAHDARAHLCSMVYATV